MIGVLGGSGVYELDGLEDARWESVGSPFGAPSDELLFGRLAGVEFVFLPRHGRGHRIPPSEINYRANIDALKRAGVTDVISVCARAARCARTSRRARSCSSISSSTAPSRARRASSARAASRTCRWRTRCARASHDALEAAGARARHPGCVAAARTS